MTSVSGRSVVVAEATIIDWTPRLALQMVTRGVRVGDRDIPRPVVLRRLAAVARAWWRWTTALPGDVFYDLRRDVFVQVAAGTPSNRTVRLMSGLYRARGGDFLDCPPEPTAYRWHDLGAA